VAPAKLVSGEGIEFPLAAPEGRRLWVGRSQQGTPPQADLIDLSSLPGGRSVSHLHAQVYRTPAGWVLHEGKTTNATLVNGRQLTQGEDVPLTNGASIQLGRVLLTFNENRQARIVPSDILTLEADQQELTIDPGRTESIGLRLVNATGRVEMIDVEVEGLPKEWYQIAQADGTRAPVWRVQLVPTGPDLINPLPNSVANAQLIIIPPRVPQSRAGTYPITISATTRGEDRVRRVITGRVHILPFEGLQFALTPTEARGGAARFTAEVTNTGNADADVELVLEPDQGLRCTADPPRLRLANGADQRSILKARVKRHHWWGPRRTYGLHVTATAGTERLREGIALTCFPRIPEWLQGLLSRLFAILSPIAIPAVTLVLLLGLAYLFLRPPDIAQFYASAPAVPAGGTVQLNWSGDRIANVEIEPPPATKPSASDRQVSVTPDKTTEYTFTAKNWIGLSSSAKARVAVVRITKFDPSTTSLTQEGQEVTLTWETDGADTVRIDPPGEISDPKPSGSAKVHPAGNTTYTLTASGPGGLEVKESRAISIGAPTLDKFEVTDPPQGTRVFPGGQVKLNWKATGATKAIITADKGDVAPGQKQLDVTSGPPATVQPTATGDVTYTLTVSNAAGTQQASVKVSVTAVAVSQFEFDPPAVFPNEPSKLSWRVDGANDSTKVSIDPNVGPVPATGQKTFTPTETTDYTLTVTNPDGSSQQQTATLTVKPPLPQINVFTAPNTSITQGDQVRLTWNTANAESVEIRRGDGSLLVQSTQPAGNVTDKPTTPTTYILTAIGISDRTTKDFSVDVKPPPTPAPPSAAPAATQ
jgi:FHA domain-containing protein